ncbi:MAG: alpha-mannosyltransferase [Rhodospirillales bacterium CG15_BIG_FIL_POST_REV_8_21_14_020_66_15]|nr:MAG: alpha-mannosyltransferase [Rhodospirillales bacterium CG15_BIG_FIL_POST_REV_8_21_14_020_66_15]
MRISVVTDAWYPQPNGVVRVMGTMVERLKALGHAVQVIAPNLFATLPCPTYPDIRLSLFPGRRLAALLDDFQPNAIHIATEGPLGSVARRYCVARGLPFTTAYHSKFPEYIHARAPVIPLGLLYRWIRGFHAPSARVMVPSHSVHDELAAKGFANLQPWCHGVDTEVFKPAPKDFLDHLNLPRPLFMFLGRVTVEKNLPAFLDLDLPGSKVVVGSGPARNGLMARYPRVPFLIARGDAELARYYNAADVFVFPSRTDTFGLVMLEALACGVPVAAFPVTGPKDVIGASGAGVLDDDLAAAAVRAQDIGPALCRNHALGFSWDAVVSEFLDYLAPFGALQEPPAQAAQ